MITNEILPQTTGAASFRRLLDSASEIFGPEVPRQPLFVVSDYPPTTVLELLGNTLVDLGPGAVRNDEESRPNATEAGPVCVVTKPRPRNRHDGMPLSTMRRAKEHIHVKFGWIPKPRPDGLLATAESP